MDKYIIISKGNRNSNIMISSKHKFFNKREIHYEYRDNCLIFRTPMLDDTKQIIKPQFDKKSKLYRFYMNIPLKVTLENRRYEIDNDYLTEDELSIYCL